MYSEQKWEASEAKTRFAKSFPGLETDADLARSKTPQATFTLPSNGVKLILYTDNTFCFEPLNLNDVPLLLTALRESRPYLSALYSDAFQRLDELTAHDAELSRLSKMEKLLGAIVNNSLEIPALYHLVQKQLEDVSTLPQHTLTGEDKIKLSACSTPSARSLQQPPNSMRKYPKYSAAQAH